jgi:hypothetical protein
LPMDCTFIFAPIDGLRPMSNMKGFYAQGAQRSSVERLCLITRNCTGGVLVRWVSGTRQYPLSR